MGTFHCHVWLILVGSFSSGKGRAFSFHGLAWGVVFRTSGSCGNCFRRCIFRYAKNWSRWTLFAGSARAVPRAFAVQATSTALTSALQQLCLSVRHAEQALPRSPCPRGGGPWQPARAGPESWEHFQWSGWLWVRKPGAADPCDSLSGPDPCDSLSGPMDPDWVRTPATADPCDSLSGPMDPDWVRTPATADHLDSRAGPMGSAATAGCCGRCCWGFRGHWGCHPGGFGGGRRGWSSEGRWGAGGCWAPRVGIRLGQSQHRCLQLCCFLCSFRQRFLQWPESQCPQVSLGPRGAGWHLDACGTNNKPRILVVKNFGCWKTLMSFGFLSFWLLLGNLCHLMSFVTSKLGWSSWSGVPLWADWSSLPYPSGWGLSSMWPLQGGRDFCESTSARQRPIGFDHGLLLNPAQIGHGWEPLNNSISTVDWRQLLNFAHTVLQPTYQSVGCFSLCHLRWPLNYHPPAHLAGQMQTENHLQVLWEPKMQMLTGADCSCCFVS